MKQNNKNRDNNMKVITMTEDEFKELLAKEAVNVMSKMTGKGPEKKEVMVKKEQPKEDNAFTVLGGLINEPYVPVYNADKMYNTMAPISPIYYENGNLLGCTNPFDPLIISYKAMIDKLCEDKSNGAHNSNYECELFTRSKHTLIQMYTSAFFAMITSYNRSAILSKFQFSNTNMVTRELEQMVSNITPNVDYLLNCLITDWYNIDTSKYNDGDKNLIKYDYMYCIRNAIGVDISKNLMEFARKISFSDKGFNRDTYLNELNTEDPNYSITPEMLYTLQSIEYTCILNGLMSLVEMMLAQMKMSYEFLGLSKLRNNGCYIVMPPAEDIDGEFD